MAKGQIVFIKGVGVSDPKYNWILDEKEVEYTYGVDLIGPDRLDIVEKLLKNNSEEEREKAFESMKADKFIFPYNKFSKGNFMKQADPNK